MDSIPALDVLVTQVQLQEEQQKCVDLSVSLGEAHLSPQRSYTS